MGALRKAKEYMTEMVRFEQHARYKAEEAGNRYTKAKAAAIEEDNALQEEKHETEKVALKAVARKAKLDEEKVQAEQRAALQKHKSEFTHSKVKKVEHHKGHKHDCKTLPEVYVKAGGKCSDCPKWTKKGECKAAQFKKFMHHYCAGSCAKQEKEEAAAAAIVPL